MIVRCMIPMKGWMKKQVRCFAAGFLKKIIMNNYARNDLNSTKTLHKTLRAPTATCTKRSNRSSTLRRPHKRDNTSWS